MKKETYKIKIYKLTEYLNVDEAFIKFNQKLSDRDDVEIKANGSTEDNGYNYAFFSYTINHTDNADIKWFVKWKSLFGIDSSLRSSSKTGHGVIIIQNRIKSIKYTLVFGRAFPLVKDLIVQDYGISMADKIFDGKSADAISSKYYSLVKNKAIFDYYEGSSMFIEDGQAIDLIDANIIEDASDDSYTSITELQKYIQRKVKVTYSSIRAVICKEKIILSDFSDILEILQIIERTYLSRFEIPRMNPVSNKLSELLDNQLLYQLKNQLEDEMLQISIPLYFKDDSETYDFLSNVIKMRMYYNKVNLVKEVINHDDIRNFLISASVSNLRDVIVTFYTESNQKKLSLLEWVDTNLEYVDDDGVIGHYILYEGKWCTFNDSYINRINYKVSKFEKECIIESPEFSVSDEELEIYLTNNSAILSAIFSSSNNKTLPYREFVYNYIITQKKGWNLFDRQLYNMIEICDIDVVAEAHIHVKFGDSSSLEAAMRQSIIGNRIYERDGKNINLLFKNKLNEKLSRPKKIAIIFLKDFKGNLAISKSKSLKLKQTFIDWYEEITNSKKKPSIIVANYSQTKKEKLFLWDRLDVCIIR